ncbi:hypothetical protein [Stenotrophomonas maltophilia]|uniref:nSTAND3 domain-containing NTPase n=1 Tax=Stenotrophomonas maltophilia TaxID=40324 RepID=UPI001658B828|nr:hypothetical protein [Stenotrophomonas maltophilia]MBC9114606.1 hypothetical protein [Stenotrophomonas maltophilia]
MNNGQKGAQDTKSVGSGSHSMIGYEYQIDVSVWLALDLVLSSELASEVVLEPATEEDIEADMEEAQPGSVVTTAEVEHYRLIVQAKLRSGDAWSVAGVKRLLEHGKSRPSAASRLGDLRNRYLLVTSAGVNGAARKLHVRSPGLWPKAADMAASIKSALPAGSAGRVAIIGNQDLERLERDIKTLLSEKLRVPNSRLEACRRKLRDEARARIGGAGGGRWSRAELEKVIRAHDGYIASSPELEHYVKPINWADIRSAVFERNAVLITGQSGTGKTMATLKLYDELRKEIPGLTRVHVTRGPGQIRTDNTPPPVLYDIEDPWGRYDFDPNSRPWNDKLAEHLSHARPDRLVVATSRLDVARSSGALSAVKRWEVSLEAEHYGTRERQWLYQTRIDGLPRNVQMRAKENQSAVLAELATPLEIQKFFDALATTEEGKKRPDSQLIGDAIKRAHQDSIEQTVVDQIEERKDVRAAAVLWGLLKANDKLSLQLLRELDSLLADKSDAFERGAVPLVNFFVAARNLRQSGATISYYHPRVEAGIERALMRSENVTVRALRLLIETLCSVEGPGEEWGIGASARLLFSLTATPDLRPKLSANVQGKIDAWLTELVCSGGREFERNLRLAKVVGSRHCNVAEVSRFLLHRPDESFGGIMTWGAPPRQQDWYDRLRGDESVRVVVETFIREVLPQGRDNISAKFVTAVGRLVPNLTPAFLDAASTAVRFGHIWSDQAILMGALEDLQGFESVVDLAVAELTPSQEELQRAADFMLSYKNKEFSEEFAQHYAEDDSGWVAGQFLAGYVDKVRGTLGWSHLHEHRHRDQLLPTWLNRLEEGVPPSVAELRGIYGVTRHTDSEKLLWPVLTKHWLSEFENDLLEVVRVGHQDPVVRMEALTCLVDNAATRLPLVSGHLLQSGDEARLIEIALELGDLRYRRDVHKRGRKEGAVPFVVPVLPGPFDEVADAAYAVLKELIPVLSEAAQSVVRRIAPSSEVVRAFRVKVDAHVPVGSVEDARWLLAHSDDETVAELAIEFAIRHGLSEDVSAGLTHRFADVVAPAMAAVAAALTAPLPPSILALASNKGSRVCRTLVGLLDAKPHANHRAALLFLSKNEWSTRGPYYEEEDDFPIAQAAVTALGKMGALDAATADELYGLAIGTRDSTLRCSIFLLLINQAEERFQDALMDISLNPGNKWIRQQASLALAVGHERIAPSVLQRITPRVLISKTPAVASRLLLLLTCAGDVGAILRAAEMVSASSTRRVLLLLMIWQLREHDQQLAERIGRMLPSSSVGIAWALAGGGEGLSDTALENLGDPACVEQVMSFMQPKRRGA